MTKHNKNIDETNHNYLLKLFEKPGVKLTAISLGIVLIFSYIVFNAYVQSFANIMLNNAARHTNIVVNSLPFLLLFFGTFSLVFGICTTLFKDSIKLRLNIALIAAMIETFLFMEWKTATVIVTVSGIIVKKLNDLSIGHKKQMFKEEMQTGYSNMSEMTKPQKIAKTIKKVIWPGEKWFSKIPTLFFLLSLTSIYLTKHSLLHNYRYLFLACIISLLLWIYAALKYYD